MDLIIKNGRVIDPQSNTNEVLDVLIEKDIIKSIGKTLKVPKDIQVIDADGLLVIPGLVDMHCHLRDPGDPEEETIFSGTRSAVEGGFTSIACMANTSPPIDNPSMVKYIISKSFADGVCNVFPIGAVTLGLEGKKLVEMGRMIEEGVVAFSDDGRPVFDPKIMRLALEYSKIFGSKIISHAEDLSLSSGGQMNEGAMSTILGLKGIPDSAEEFMVERDIKLAEEFGGAIHITHVSTAGSVNLIRAAKKRGLAITSDTCPHYFSLTEKNVDGFNTYAKVSPPLRTEEDVKEIIEGLKDGTIDAISTDHAPHREEHKKIEFGFASNGMVGFETALSVSLTFLAKYLSIDEIIKKMTINPSNALGINKGKIKENSIADVVIIDLNFEYTVDINKFVSKSKNSAFNGMKLKGKVIHTIVSGNVVVKNSKLTAIPS